MKRIIALFLAVSMVLGLTACADIQSYMQSAAVEEATAEVENETAEATDVAEDTDVETSIADYSKDENWLIKYASNMGDYDLIFIYGTAVGNPTRENGVGDICDEMRVSGKQNFVNCGSQLAAVKSSKGNAYQANVFVPLYCQMALNYILPLYETHDDLKIADRDNGPYDDMKAALDYYFENYNPNAERPFVLAGHSQGSAMLQVVLEEYFIKNHKDYLKNMIAAYSTGYGISKKWFDGLDKELDGEDVIHFATGATDTNCVLSWNTEGPDPDDGTNCLLTDEPNDTYIINPLNWKTDETPATRDENLGVLISNPDYDEDNPYSTSYIVSTDYDELFNGQLNLERGVLVCTEHNGTYVNIPPFGAIWGGKSLHCSDGAGFYVNMNQNLGDRIDVFFGK